LRADRSLHLTDGGRSLATTVVRRHRLAERLLADIIGLEWEKVHREADRWEHAISADVEEKLVALLGDPATCPHGNPIPGSKRATADGPAVLLSGAQPGDVTVRRISEKLELSDDGLKFVVDASLVPGSPVTVVGRDPDGVRVRSANGEHVVPANVAQQLYVSAS
jgi:DtxR family Mn-dependent transcriptional regulator